MASRAHHPVLPRLDAMEPERPPPPLVDELFEEIFLRVASPAELARVSAACGYFRRLISNPSFLCRYRSVHPPLLLGFFYTDFYIDDFLSGLVPVEATHPSAAVARAVARTADFSLDFLPTPRSWYPCDVCDGCVLVRRREHRFHLAVCDPLFQRYLLLPPITHDLIASVALNNHDILYFRASLIPSGGMEGETSFRVICCMISNAKLVVAIFSTNSGHWAVGTISRVDIGFYGELELLDPMPGQCVYGCFYWKVHHRNKLLKLDMSTMEFSLYDLPPNYDMRSVVIVETGEGKVGMFSALGQGTYLEYYTLLQNGTEKSHKWHLKSTIPLPVHDTSLFVINGQAKGYVFLTHVIEEQDTDTPYVEFFSLEVKSCNIERVCRAAISIDLACPYFGFPPSMSPRRIQGYGELQD